MLGSTNSLAEITYTSSKGIASLAKRMDCNRLNQTPIPQHIFPVSISAASAEHSSEKCSADIIGFQRGKGAHVNRHELALTCLIQTPTDSSAVKERHFCTGYTNPETPSSRAAAATRYLYASKVAACCPVPVQALSTLRLQHSVARSGHRNQRSLVC